MEPYLLYGGAFYIGMHVLGLALPDSMLFKVFHLTDRKSYSESWVGRPAYRNVVFSHVECHAYGNQDFL